MCIYIMKNITYLYLQGRSLKWNRKRICNWTTLRVFLNHSTACCCLTVFNVIFHGMSIKCLLIIHRCIIHLFIQNQWRVSFCWASSKSELLELQLSLIGIFLGRIWFPSPLRQVFVQYTLENKMFFRYFHFIMIL